MSRLQNAAQPLLLPLIQGHPIELGSSDLQLLANWAVMTFCNIDLDDLEQSVIPREHRIIIRKAQPLGPAFGSGDPYGNMTPPPGWRIWIAPNRSRFTASFFHRPMSGTDYVSGQRKVLRQSTTMGFGAILFHCANGRAVTQTYNRAVEEYGLRPIWPIKRSINSRLLPFWPSKEAVISLDHSEGLDDDEVLNLVEALPQSFLAGAR